MQYIIRDAINDDDLGKLWTSHDLFKDFSFEEQASESFEDAVAGFCFATNKFGPI